MGEDQTNKLRNMLDNLMTESSDFLLDDVRDSDAHHLDNDLLASTRGVKVIELNLLSSHESSDFDDARKTSKFGLLNSASKDLEQ